MDIFYKKVFSQGWISAPGAEFRGAGGNQEGLAVEFDFLLIITGDHAPAAKIAFS
ncbi:hypothetical protein ACQCVK_21395 [Rossellomorea vietnamensis]|uniref:hypothetical protein n=1 Tax=Rossellomorea vietnamensis TaxID=218284 RepID=UPI003CF3295D